MTPEQWQEIKRILAGALERPPRERSAYLEQACTNAEVRREVESLIAADERAPGDFAEPRLGGARLQAGSKLGHYEIAGQIGAGGMGVVYKARDMNLGRLVALKVLADGPLANSTARARMLREARNASALNHPNIATIYEAGEDGPQIYIAMELVEGRPLNEVIRRDGLAPQAVSRYALQITAALAHAHERGIVHRDLKPANVVVTPEGNLKVLDFGLAKRFTASGIEQATVTENTLTEIGAIVGTLPYMAPETLRGEEADARADVWALGAIMYEMAAGAPPFKGKTAYELSSAILRETPPALPSRVPSGLQSVMQRCLAKEREQRYQRASEVRAALEVIAPHSVAEAGAASAPPRRWWWAAGVLAIALIAAAIWKFNAPRPQLSMRFSAVTSFAGVQAQPAVSPDGRSVAFVSDRDGHYNIYVGLLSGGSLVEITHDANFKSRPAWSPDGATIAYAQLNDSGLWDIWEVPALGGTPRRVILNATDPAWSPDGKSLAYVNVTDGTLWASGIYGENGRRLTGSDLGDTGRVAEPRFSPDGHRIAFLVRFNGPYAELQVLDVSSGKIRSLANYGALTLSPVWSPGGRSIYFASSRGGTINVWEIPAEGGEPRQITEGQGDDAQLDVSPDGNRIVFSTWRESNYLARLDLMAKPDEQGWKPLGADPGRNQLAPAYSPDGRHLAYFSNLKGTENENIWVSDADGSNAVQLVHDNWSNVFPRWSSDSKHVIYWSEGNVDNGEAIRIIPLSGGAPKTIVKENSDIFVDVALDGRLLFRNATGQVEAFDPRNRSAETHATSHPSDSAEPLRWSPDGRSIAYVVHASSEDDPVAGLWVENFKNPPRQVFRGWVESYAVGPNDEIYVVEGKPDLNGVIWKVRWDGQGLTRLSAMLRMSHDYFVDPSLNPQDHLTVSPDGRYLVADHLAILTANIGMIENVH